MPTASIKIDTDELSDKVKLFGIYRGVLDKSIQIHGPSKSIKTQRGWQFNTVSPQEYTGHRLGTAPGLVERQWC